MHSSEHVLSGSIVLMRCFVFVVTLANNIWACARFIWLIFPSVFPMIPPRLECAWVRILKDTLCLNLRASYGSTLGFRLCHCECLSCSTVHRSLNAETLMPKEDDQSCVWAFAICAHTWVKKLSLSDNVRILWQRDTCHDGKQANKSKESSWLWG